MRTFDYSFLAHELLPPTLINMGTALASLRTAAEQRKELHPGIFSGLEYVARIQSVKTSNAIEGIITSDERIEAIVNKNSAPLNHDEQEIAGYRDALDFIHNNYSEIDISIANLLSLHQMMLAYTPLGGGSWKSSDNYIIEVNSQGMRSIRFTPTPANETPAAIEQLTLAYLDARDNANINPLLLIPCFILDFLCIHPFSDGNGRMSRLLSLLSLYHFGYDIGRYISFEEQINNDKIRYYESLRQSSANWHENANSYLPFIEQFALTLLRCYQELDKRFAIVSDKRLSKQNRIEATVLNSLLPISKREIAAILPDVSPTTIEKVLGEMVKAQQIQKIGAGRSTRYKRSKISV